MTSKHSRKIFLKRLFTISGILYDSLVFELIEHV